AVQAAGMQTLNKDQRLSYDVERGRNGKEAAINLAQA
ncbi:MAG: cold-shock protein, partial [Croceibacterium sp.]